MSRTIVEEWHGVFGVSRPHPARFLGSITGSGLRPVSAASAGL